MDIKSITNGSVPLIRTLKTNQKQKVDESFTTKKAPQQKSVQKTSELPYVQTVSAVLYSDDILEDEKKRSLKRGKTLLDGLDQLKIDLLNGQLSKETLLSLKDELAKKNDHNLPDSLKKILDEIETRVAVELAKYISN
ncbi:MAG: hypothetical protein HEEMFOPI_01061 [Holosporales bacterium]